MRLLMLNNEFPPLGGGTGTVNRAILQRLAGVPDLEIDLVTSALGSRRESRHFARRIRILAVPVENRDIHHSSNRELAVYSLRALALALRLHLREPYDFCFAWSAVPAGGVALALKGLVGLPYLVRVCGPDIPGFERRYRRLYPILTPLIRSVWRGAETVVAKCQGEAAMVRSVDGAVGLSLVPNGVDLREFRPGAAIPDDGPLRLLCVARLIERKGQGDLITAVERLASRAHDVRLELVGTGDARDAYEARVRDAGLASKVRFAGYVPREEIHSRYAQAHVFVLPSRNEGMSVATLEAMAAGLPLVVTRTGGTAELVAEGRNGLTFEWGDVDALTAHLAALHDDRATARVMGAASRERAKRFSWDAAAMRYIELLNSLTQTAAIGPAAIRAER